MEVSWHGPHLSSSSFPSLGWHDYSLGLGLLSLNESPCLLSCLHKLPVTQANVFRLQIWLDHSLTSTLPPLQKIQVPPLVRLVENTSHGLFGLNPANPSISPFPSALTRLPLFPKFIMLPLVIGPVSFLDWLPPPCPMLSQLVLFGMCSYPIYRFCCIFLIRLKSGALWMYCSLLYSKPLTYHDVQHPIIFSTYDLATPLLGWYPPDMKFVSIKRPIHEYSQ